MHIQQRRFERLHRGLDVHLRWQHVLYGFLRLQARPGHAGDHELVRPDVLSLHELSQAGDGHTTRGLGEDAFGLGQQADALHDLIVADRGTGAVR